MIWYNSSSVMAFNYLFFKTSIFRVNMLFFINIQVGEAVEAQYVPVEDEEQLTEAPVAALQDNGKSSISGKHNFVKHGHSI